MVWKALSNLENKKTMRFSPQSTRRRVLTKVARHSLLKSRHMPSPATQVHTQLGLEKILLSLFLLSTVSQLPFRGINHQPSWLSVRFRLCFRNFVCFQLHFLLTTLNSYAVIRSGDMGYWNIQLITIQLLLEE